MEEEIELAKLTDDEASNCWTKHKLLKSILIELREIRRILEESSSINR